jgi:DNA-directed RNA polymerase subunit beta'
MNRLRALAAQRDRGRLPAAQPALPDAATDRQQAAE